MAGARELTVAQHARLDRLAKDEPDAKVVGWTDTRSGPVILRRGGRLSVVVPPGRLGQLWKEEAAAFDDEWQHRRDVLERS